MVYSITSALIREPSDPGLYVLRRFSCRIRSHESKEGRQIRTGAREHHVFYSIECEMCEHGSRPKATWVVQHRYSTLLKLYKQLRDLHQSFGKLPFPGKTWGAASDRVIEERKAAIQNYINLAVANTHAIEECDSTVVASVLQAFDHLFEYHHHSQPPKAHRTPTKGGVIEADSIHHVTNEDLQFAAKIKRSDSMNDFNQRRKSGEWKGKSGEWTPPKGRT